MQTCSSLVKLNWTYPGLFTSIQTQSNVFGINTSYSYVFRFDEVYSVVLGLFKTTQTRSSLFRPTPTYLDLITRIQTLFSRIQTSPNMFRIIQTYAIQMWWRGEHYTLRCCTATYYTAPQYATLACDTQHHVTWCYNSSRYSTWI